MNLLLTCIGARIYVVNAFRRALSGDGQVFVCDCRADAAFMVGSKGERPRRDWFKVRSETVVAKSDADVCERNFFGAA